MSQNQPDPSADEQDLFREAMGDVQPLPDQQRAPTAQRRDGPTAAQLAAREAALHHRQAKVSAAERYPLTTEEVPEVGPHDLIEWKKAGVQHGVYKKLRLGRYRLEARLDLHRRTVEQARVDLVRFIEQCHRYGVRTALVTHGKGDRGPTPGRIKSYVATWLPLLPGVLAVHSAQPQHGGYGSVYVLLQKSEEQKADNREQHGLKGNRAHTT